MTRANESEHKSRLNTALRAVIEAEKIILGFYQSPTLRSEFKHDKSVVTEADRKAEEVIRAVIEKEFPFDSIIGEELEPKSPEHSDKQSEYQWILDPIDGTQSFVCGVPLFGTMIGITYQDRPAAGVVHMPALRETYYAEVGHGAWYVSSGSQHPVAARASSAKKLSESLFLTTSHSGFERAQCPDLMPKFMDATRKFRGWGSCYGHMLVATGRADLIVEPDLKIWDCAALLPIVQEAGGAFFDLKGEARIDGGSGISCAPGLAEEIMNLLSGNHSS